MPPSWPSRLLSGSSGPSQNQSSTSPLQRNSNKPLTSFPQGTQPTSTPTPLSPSRANSTPSREHTHNRSASHPLPRLFSRKKSTQNLGGAVAPDTTVDDASVPVLNDNRFTTSPTRVVSGKRRLDEDPSATRYCMCCSSKLRFPKELKVFRCTVCLTINDLEPVGSNKENERDTQGDRESRPTYLLGPKRECFLHRIHLHANHT